MRYLTATDIAQLGESLRQIDPAWANQPGSLGEQRVWYQGQEPYFDLMIERQGETISWLQLTLRGQALSWQATTNRITTGETEELDMPPLVSYYAASKGIRLESNFDADFVKLAIAILQTRPEDALLSRAAALLVEAMKA
ncbi:MAG: hypothetical protein HC929_01295 [Leptolyngbyaceae cyanobacterium SM2_5_2]|nr:hypothetical protein [Leptolyngbyaceae cyanobacterium SM2_5_2]